MNAESLLNRFFYLLDERQYGGMLDLFTPDALWLRQGKPLVGRGPILKTLESRAAGMRVRHVLAGVFSHAPGDRMPDSWTGYDSRARVPDAGDAVFVTGYLTAYRFDDTGETPPPWRVHAPHKLSVVHARFVMHEGRVRMNAQLLLPEFTFD